MSGTGTGTDTPIIVGAYFTVNELRGHRYELTNETKYPDAKLTACRIFAEQWFEAAAKLAYVRREVTETHTGTGKTALLVSMTVEVGPVIAVTIDGTALTAGLLADLVTRPYGAVERAATWPKDSEIVITYQHGFSEPCELVRTAVMMLAAEKALPSTIPARATSLSTDVGNYRISQADKTGKTGIPDVDAIIGLLGDNKPVTG